ncbi:MAG: V-type ATP synthase subunit I [Candidatus Aramenus sp.]|nr:V-type ATP synthase subunit I [Candidatus Aramenus sp.]
MLFPETMTKVEVISLKDRIDSIVTEVLKFGMFEPKEPTEPISQGRIEGARRLLGEIQEHITKLKIIMDIAGLVLEPQGKMKLEGDWITTSEAVSKESSEEENKYAGLLEEIGKLRAEIDIYKAQMKELEPFSEVDVELERLSNLEYFDVILATISRDQLEALKKEQGVFISYKEVVGAKETRYAAIIIAPKNQLEHVIAKLGIRRLETATGGSPRQAYEEVVAKAKNLEEILETARSQLAKKVRENSTSFRQLLGKLMTVRDALNLLSKVRVSENFAQLEGFVPEKKVKEIKAKLEKLGAFVDYAYPKRYGEKEEPPTYVNLPKRIKAIESVINIYGAPSYWELSPAIFLIVTFPIIFGLMFPDTGDALVVFLFSIWFYRYGVRKGSDNIKNLSLILIYSSVVAIFTGFLAREFFGPLLVGGLEELNPSQFPGDVGPLYSVWPIPLSVAQRLAFLLPFGEYATASSIENTMIFSVFLGSIALFVSSLVGVLNAVRKRDPEFLVFEKLPLLLIYIAPFLIFSYGIPQGISNGVAYFNTEKAILGYVLHDITNPGSPDLSNPTAVFSYVMILWIEVAILFNWVTKIILLRRHEHTSVGSAIGLGFMEGGFEAALLLMSNTISFIRILVFALAHYYLLYAFSYMAYLVVGKPSLLAIFTNPAAIALIFVGNLLAIGLEGLIVFIQDMRLHFYEMFSKFYEGRGRQFEPALAYVEIE